MIYKTIPYSLITHRPINIITPWIDNIKNEWYKIYGGFHTGLDIEATTVWSRQRGCVVQIGDENNHKIVTVQVNVNFLLRYGNLKEVNTKLGEIAAVDTIIGTADKYVHFEYCTLAQGQSRYPVRIGVATYYKQDPEPIIMMDFNSSE